jgi:hypothetical protein
VQIFRFNIVVFVNVCSLYVFHDDCAPHQSSRTTRGLQVYINTLVAVGPGLSAVFKSFSPTSRSESYDLRLKTAKVFKGYNSEQGARKSGMHQKLKQTRVVGARLPKTKLTNEIICSNLKQQGFIFAPFVFGSASPGSAPRLKAKGLTAHRGPKTVKGSKAGPPVGSRPPTTMTRARDEAEVEPQQPLLGRRTTWTAQLVSESRTRDPCDTPAERAHRATKLANNLGTTQGSTRDLMKRHQLATADVPPTGRPGSTRITR